MSTNTLPGRTAIESQLVHFCLAAIEICYDWAVVTTRLLRDDFRKWHDEEHLKTLPDHLLKDIGVERSDIEIFVRTGHRPRRD